MQHVIIFSLILGSLRDLRGQSLDPPEASQYEKLNLLKYSPALHFPDFAQKFIN
jgi:hypothetical protein